MYQPLIKFHPHPAIITQVLRIFVAKIWIEENGINKIEIAWSELSATEETEILQAIDKHWDELNKSIDAVFAGKKISPY